MTTTNLNHPTAENRRQRLESSQGRDGTRETAVERPSLPAGAGGGGAQRCGGLWGAPSPDSQSAFRAAGKAQVLSGEGAAAGSAAGRRDVTRKGRSRKEGRPAEPGLYTDVPDGVSPLSPLKHTRPLSAAGWRCCAVGCSTRSPWRGRAEPAVSRPCFPVPPWRLPGCGCLAPTGPTRRPGHPQALPRASLGTACAGPDRTVAVARASASSFHPACHTGLCGPISLPFLVTGTQAHGDTEPTGCPPRVKPTPRTAAEST